jgi:anti-sigma-K factor RskA
MLVAAGLAALLVAMKARPEVLPEALRPKPKIVQVVNNVEVVAAHPADYVAILQKEPFAPAFILTFDYAKKTVTARAVNAPHEADKSYELWIVPEKSPNPRSLGVIGEQQFTVRQSLAGTDASFINRATSAVSLAPRGGSPTGVPTGALVFKGKLIQATPPALTQMP